MYKTFLKIIRHRWPLFRFISVFFEQTIQILHQIYVKNVHPGFEL